MATTKTRKVIGLWQDTTGGGNEWIVSRDEMNERGEAETTHTIATYEEGEYYQALAAAKSLARKHGLPVVETDTDGGQKTVYTPEPNGLEVE